MKKEERTNKDLRTKCIIQYKKKKRHNDFLKNKIAQVPQIIGKTIPEKMGLDVAIFISGRQSLFI